MTRPHPDAVNEASRGRSTPRRRRLIVLGSTGSIGVNCLAVVEHLRATGQLHFDVVGLVTGSKADLVLEQARSFDVPNVAIATPSAIKHATHSARLHEGAHAALELINAVAQPGDLVVGAMVGSAGIPAILAAIDRGCDIALANKETLVAAGELVMPRVRAKGVNLLPIDSEHSAIFQCLLSGRSIEEVKRLVITASGGPFRAWTRERMERATVEEALNHPTWSMGPKVTIDSASLMNKALEIIEAHWLFGLPADKIDVIVHPQSLMHSFVEFVDGSVIAQLGPPDMRTPIQYALTWPHRATGISRVMDWENLRRMDFEPVDQARFEAPHLARRVIEVGGTAGAILNAANEAAVAAFLDRRIEFTRITKLVREALDAIETAPVQSLDDVMLADQAAREFVKDRLSPRVHVGRPADLAAVRAEP
jgi:1-deoxy-D-xylulose-5-phosphate reductoisomerase